MTESYSGSDADIAAKLQANLAAIVESSDDAIIGKTLDGIITSWNRSAERIFGYTADEAIGRHISLIIPKERNDEEFVIIGKVRSGQRVDHFETVRRRKDGTAIDISLTVSPILDARGNIVGASKVARDISGQKQTEILLADAGRRKDEFLANMSHELRTPMNAVIGISHLLAMSQSLSSKDQRLVVMLKQSADSMMALINNLLDFSRLETGVLHLEETEFDLPSLVEKTMVMVEVAARDKGLTLEVQWGMGVRDRYIGDPLRLQQVLSNLLANAIKFTEHGGVEIAVRLREARGAVSLMAIDIADTGVGIPPDKIGVIFDKFMQADASTTRKFGGSGLGLSICRAIAENMGGAISVVSRQDIGSTFTLEVPLRNAAVQTVVAGGADARRERKNVLVVDDYEPNIVVVTSMLDHLGYNYDVAQNGLEAVRRSERGEYDVILMDIQMPGMDGFESTRRIRAIESEKNLAATPIVAITAHVLERDKVQCFRAGMNAFIPKPFEPAVLRDVLAEFIPSGASH